MRGKVLGFYSLLVLVVVVLGILQFSSFGSLTGHATFDDSTEWTFGNEFGIGFLGYDINGEKVSVRYVVEDFDDVDGDLKISYGIEGNEIKSERIFLGAGENLEITLNERLVRNNARGIFNVIFNDGNGVIEDEVILFKNNRGINSYAIEGDDGISSENKFSVYGIAFIVLILVGLIFEFVYVSVKKGKNNLGHGFNRKFNRKTIKLDVS